MTKQEILDVIVTHVREVEPDLLTHELSGSDSMRELGLDSMQRVEVLILSMGTVNVQVPRTALAQAKCLDDVAEIMWKHSRESESS